MICWWRRELAAVEFGFTGRSGFIPRFPWKLIRAYLGINPLLRVTNETEISVP